MPSIANFAHVCSHLQNASMARLGVTSIPYTRLHLGFALMLHKQGFISQLKLAGRSPPRSLFPTSQSSTPPASSKRQQIREDAAQLASLGDSVEQTQALNELELQFLLENYKKSEEEVMQILQGSRSDIEAMNQDNDTTMQLKGDLATGEEVMNPERLADLMRTHRRLVIEAERLAEIQGGGAALVHQLVSRVLQSADPTSEAEASGKSQGKKPKDVGKFDTDPGDPDQEGIVTQENISSRRLWLGMKYWDGEPVLRKARVISTPKKNITLDLSELKRLLGGRDAKTVSPIRNVGEIVVMKTSLGVIEAREALQKRVGGLALARVW